MKLKYKQKMILNHFPWKAAHFLLHWEKNKEKKHKKQTPQGH